MLKLYIVRHGQTEWNRDRKLQGRLNSDLTSIGKEQAIALGNYFADNNIKFDKYYSSPQGRAFDTASYIAKGNKVEKRDGLCEIAFGSWEGQEVDTLKKDYTENFNNFFTNAHLYEPHNHGGESFEEVEARVKNELDYITSTYQNKTANIMFVSHGITIKVLFKILKNHSLEEFWSSEVFQNSSVSLVTYDNGRFNVEYISNTDHLDESLTTSWTAK